MQNPNEYDDDKFLEASNDLLSRLPQILDAFWEAGARLEDIAGDLSTAFEMCDSSDLATSNLKVEILDAHN